MTTPPAIRPISPPDWPAVDHIQRAAFDAGVVEELAVFQSFAALSPSTCLLAEIDQEPVGYLLAHPWIPDDMPPLATALAVLPALATSLFIHDLALAPARRGRGTARALTEAGLRAGQTLGLSTASLLSVQGSQPFWEHMGFQPRPDLAPRITPIVRRFTTMAFVFMSRADLTIKHPAPAA